MTSYFKEEGLGGRGIIPISREKSSIQGEEASKSEEVPPAIYFMGEKGEGEKKTVS